MVIGEKNDKNYNLTSILFTSLCLPLSLPLSLSHPNQQITCRVRARGAGWWGVHEVKAGDG